MSDHFGLSRRIVIVGAGLGGTATAIRLLQFAREPVEIVLIERRSEYRNAGPAYHRESNHWHHVFNIQAGRMSAFREDVDDFVNWANHEADRDGWPPQWRGFTFTEPGPAPRRIYPDYLADRLAQAAGEALAGVTLIEADGEVVDLEIRGTHVDVVISRPDGPATLTADHVILATGLEQKYPAFAAGVIDHPAFVRHPYSADGIERILAVAPDAVVAIVGTLLSAYDSAALLLRHGHAGPIHMISRSGDLLPGQRLVMRLLDLRSDDAAKITTGVAVSQEPNPDLGLHGARGLLAERHYPRAFRALRSTVRERLGPDAAKLSFAVPFVNDPDEYRQLRTHLGLPDNFPLSAFIETPAAVHSAAGFCAAGASELFVGTKDLVQFYLAADRKNHLVASSYRTRHPAVMAGLRHVVTTARRAATPVHVFALLADMDYYVRRLAAHGFMMCTAELQQLARSSRSLPA